MNKESERILSVVSILLLFTLLLLVAHGRIHRLERELDAYKNAPSDTITIIKHDTIKVDSPVPVHHYIKDTTYLVVPDTQIVHDTVLKLYKAPREFVVYKDTSYRAVVSGVQPRLDSIEIYRKNITETVTKYVEVKKKTKWGLGVQAGYGYDGKKLRPYLGAGVQYNIVSW